MGFISLAFDGATSSPGLRQVTTRARSQAVSSRKVMVGECLEWSSLDGLAQFPANQDEALNRAGLRIAHAQIERGGPIVS